MLRLFFVFLVFLQSAVFAQNNLPPAPDQLYGDLFKEVQLKRIFPDSKTFVDCIALLPAEEILGRYKTEKGLPGFDLEAFIRRHFRLPVNHTPYSTGKKDIREHITQLWHVLQRPADTIEQGSSLLPLPYPYIVPGGRFREIYYWDSYFTMLGLKESGEYGMMENMVKNFAWLIQEYGHIPNGNRSYYLSRSQPPFFSLMVELLASVKGDSVYIRFLPALEKELEYWDKHITRRSSDGARENLQKWWIGPNNQRVYRYFDTVGRPRQESFYEDSILFLQVRQSNTNETGWDGGHRIRMNQAYGTLYRNLRSAAESGWDFSSRWFGDGKDIRTINTQFLSPVDLNCLIWHLKSTLAKAYRLGNQTAAAKKIEAGTADIARQMSRYFWNHKIGWYTDYNAGNDKLGEQATLAGMYPLFFKLADKKELPRIIAILKNNFLKDGGVVTSLQNTGHQWDAPNGWAPLQWITIIGLENYGYHDLAREIATRWVALNKKVFEETGRLMEKYDVINIGKPAGGGEYPAQDGFGWTNGVLLALMNKYRL